jgi:hypothetical protein
MVNGQTHLVDDIYDGGKRLEATWVAVALLYGKPPNMLDSNAFEIKQAMAKFREALVGQYPYVAEWHDQQLMGVHRLYTEWYVNQEWERNGTAEMARKAFEMVTGLKGK